MGNYGNVSLYYNNIAAETLLGHNRSFYFVLNFCCFLS